MRSVLTVFLLAGVLASSTLAQSELRQFEKDIKAKSQAKRLRAVSLLKKSGDPKAIPLALKYLGRNAKEITKLREDYENKGAEIQAIVKKRLDDQARGGLVPGSAAVTAERQTRELRIEMEAANKKIEARTELEEALIESVGAVMKTLDDTQKDKAATAAVRAALKVRKPDELSATLKALGTAPHPAITAHLAEQAVLGKTPLIRVGALDALDGHDAAISERAAASALEDDFWQVRTTALGLLRKVGGKEAVPALIAAIEREDGRLKDEVTKTLAAITKHNFHSNTRLWQDWWSQHGGKFEGRGKDGGVPGLATAKSGGATQDKDDGTSFYGIVTKSKNIIYVLDVSGSMQWRLTAEYDEQNQPDAAPPGKSKLDSAKKELIASLDRLPSGGTFNIIFYNTSVTTWQKKMMPASAKNKDKAKEWVMATVAEGATNIFDPLETAFEIAGRGSFDKHYKLTADTIFLLSDGKPNRGRVIEQTQIRREVKKMNELKKVEVHAIALGKLKDDMLAFMKGLADENNGAYVHVK